MILWAALIHGHGSSLPALNRTFQADDLSLNDEVRVDDLLAVDAVLAGQRHDARLLLGRDDHELAVAGARVGARRGAHAAAAAAGALLRGRALPPLPHLQPGSGSE